MKFKKLIVFDFISIVLLNLVFLALYCFVKQYSSVNGTESTRIFFGAVRMVTNLGVLIYLFSIHAISSLTRRSINFLSDLLLIAVVYVFGIYFDWFNQSLVGGQIFSNGKLLSVDDFLIFYQHGWASLKIALQNRFFLLLFIGSIWQCFLVILKLSEKQRLGIKGEWLAKGIYLPQGIVWLGVIFAAVHAAGAVAWIANWVIGLQFPGIIVKSMYWIYIIGDILVSPAYLLSVLLIKLGNKIIAPAEVIAILGTIQWYLVGAFLANRVRNISKSDKLI